MANILKLLGGLCLTRICLKFRLLLLCRIRYYCPGNTCCTLVVTILLSMLRCLLCLCGFGRWSANHSVMLLLLSGRLLVRLLIILVWLWFLSVVYPGPNLISLASTACRIRYIWLSGDPNIWTRMVLMRMIVIMCTSWNICHL